MVQSLLAQATEIPSGLSSSGLSEAQANAVAVAGTAIGVGTIIFIIIASLVGLFFLIWWVILLVDLSKRDFPEKSTYLILMIASFFLGFMWLMDLIYYFAVVRKNVGKKSA